MISPRLLLATNPRPDILVVSERRIGTSAGLNLSGSNSIATLSAPERATTPPSSAPNSTSPRRSIPSSLVLSKTNPKISEGSRSVGSATAFSPRKVSIPSTG
ncbi:MAG: hypothetical protein A4E51_01099 [Methanosaeta sp. PtaU1.Bin055]|nr:MAG: hypothetical protein A4E51_01099 [Methanosaeta sp. PtaU1.Bin055]